MTEKFNGQGLADWICENMGKKDFDTVFKTTLHEMPADRESVNEILDAIKAVSIVELYEEIFDYRFREFISPETLAYLRREYKKTFILPLAYADPTYLREMPATQESVDEILNDIKNMDLPDLYEAVFEPRFRQFLSDSQLSELKEKFKRTFTLSFKDIGAADLDDSDSN